MFHDYLSTAAYFENVQIPRGGQLTAKKTIATRESFKINRTAEFE